MITGEAFLHEGEYQEILKLRKEVWNTVKELKDLTYQNNIHEEFHVQNRTLNSILAKHSTCTNVNALFKMHLDAQALKYYYSKYTNNKHHIPEKDCRRKQRKKKQI